MILRPNCAKNYENMFKLLAIDVINGEYGRLFFQARYMYEC